MMMEELFKKALGVDEPWLVKNIEFDGKSKRLDIELDFKRGSTFVDEPDNDDRKAYKAYDTVKKTWRHLNFFEHECYLHARVPRVKKDDGHIRLIMPPWSGVLSGFTLLFEALIMQLCKSMPVHEVSRFIGVSDYKIWKILELYIFGAQIGEDLSDVEVVGMDETSVRRGHDYITLFVDMARRKLIHVSDGKGSDTVVDFVESLAVANGCGEQVKQISCDMSPAFIKGVRENLPKAEITFDKFHIIKIINKAVDKVRKEEVKYNPILKEARYAVLKNDANLTEKQKKKKQELILSKFNLKTLRAMNIRESFQQIYQACDLETFTYLLKKWYFWATHSRLAPIVKAAKTIKRHWDGVINWKQTQINNGLLEGLNSVLQAAKRKARGYKKPHFKIIAFLLLGKLDFSKVNKFCLPT
jgi:transposase